MLEIETKVLHMLRKRSVFEHNWIFIVFILRQNLTKSLRLDMNFVLRPGSP